MVQSVTVPKTNAFTCSGPIIGWKRIHGTQITQSFTLTTRKPSMAENEGTPGGTFNRKTTQDYFA